MHYKTHLIGVWLLHTIYAGTNIGRIMDGQMFYQQSASNIPSIILIRVSVSSLGALNNYADCIYCLASTFSSWFEQQLVFDRYLKLTPLSGLIVYWEITEQSLLETDNIRKQLVSSLLTSSCLQPFVNNKTHT